VTTVDHHHVGVRLRDQRIGEGHAGRAGAHDAIRTANGGTVDPDVRPRRLAAASAGERAARLREPSLGAAGSATGLARAIANESRASGARTDAVELRTDDACAGCAGGTEPTASGSPACAKSRAGRATTNGTGKTLIERCETR